MASVIWVHASARIVELNIASADNTSSYIWGRALQPSCSSPINTSNNGFETTLGTVPCQPGFDFTRLDDLHGNHLMRKLLATTSTTSSAHGNGTVAFLKGTDSNTGMAFRASTYGVQTDCQPPRGSCDIDAENLKYRCQDYGTNGSFSGLISLALTHLSVSTSQSFVMALTIPVGDGNMKSWTTQSNAVLINNNMSALVLMLCNSQAVKMQYTSIYGTTSMQLSQTVSNRIADLFFGNLFKEESVTSMIEALNSYVAQTLYSNGSSGLTPSTLPDVIGNTFSSFLAGTSASFMNHIPVEAILERIVAITLLKSPFLIMAVLAPLLAIVLLVFMFLALHAQLSPGVIAVYKSLGSSELLKIPLNVESSNGRPGIPSADRRIRITEREGRYTWEVV
jgi:hypothetical protein